MKVTLTPAHRDALLSTGALAGWAARPRDPDMLAIRDVDAISHAAVTAVLARLDLWEKQERARDACTCTCTDADDHTCPVHGQDNVRSDYLSGRRE